MSLLALLAAPPAHADEARVSLRFGWRPGMSCSLRTRVAAPAGIRDSTVDLVTEATSDGLRVVVDGGLGGAPSRVIGPDGHLTRLDGTDELGALRRHDYAWERAFGMWSGLTVPEWVNGSAVQHGPSGVYPEGASTDWFYRFHIAERGDCDGRRGGPTCVTLAYAADAFGAGVAAILDGGLAAELGAGAPTWRSPRVSLRGRLKVEEGTLVPLARTEEHTIQVDAVWPFGATETLTRTTLTEEAWTCGAAAVAVADPR